MTGTTEATDVSQRTIESVAPSDPQLAARQRQPILRPTTTAAQTGTLYTSTCTGLFTISVHSFCSVT